MPEKIINYLKKTENPYMLKVGDIIVQMEYSKNRKQFKKCMLNILKQKSKMG